MNPTNDAFAGMTLSALIAFSVPFVVYFVFRRRMELRLRNVFVGAATFIVVVAVLEAMLHVYVLQTNAVTKSFLDANPLAMAVYGAAMAALFEETGRLVSMRYLVKAVPGNGTPVAYGIGHGGAECVLIAINIAAIAGIGYLIATGQAASLKLDAAAIEPIRKAIEGATFTTSLYGGLERISAFIYHVGWSLMVWHAIRSRRMIFYWLAVAGHFAIDFLAGLWQQKILPLTIGELEAVYAVVAAIVLVAIWAFARPAAEASAPSH